MCRLGLHCWLCRKMQLALGFPSAVCKPSCWRGLWGRQNKTSLGSQGRRKAVMRFAKWFIFFSFSKPSGWVKLLSLGDYSVLLAGKINSFMYYYLLLLAGYFHCRFIYDRDLGAPVGMLYTGIKSRPVDLSGLLVFPPVFLTHTSSCWSPSKNSLAPQAMPLHQAAVPTASILPHILPVLTCLMSYTDFLWVTDNHRTKKLLLFPITSELFYGPLFLRFRTWNNTPLLFDPSHLNSKPAGFKTLKI